MCQKCLGCAAAHFIQHNILPPALQTKAIIEGLTPPSERLCHTLHILQSPLIYVGSRAASLPPVLCSPSACQLPLCICSWHWWSGSPPGSSPPCLWHLASACLSRCTWAPGGQVCVSVLLHLPQVVPPHRGLSRWTRRRWDYQHTWEGKRELHSYLRSVHNLPPAASCHKCNMSSLWHLHQL